MNHKTRNQVIAGVDVNIANLKGQTALMIASMNHNALEQVIKDDNNETEDKQEEKASDSQVKIVQALINAGADVNLANQEGKTALDLAKDESIREMLINAGAILHQNTDDGGTNDANTNQAADNSKIH